MPAAAILPFHADAYGRKAGDYRIPGYPYLFDQTRPVNGRQPNSAAQADGASVGGSYIFHGGFIGAAITQNDALYRIPGIDGDDHQTRIDAHQTKFTAKGEYRPDAAAIDAVRFWAGATDYKHNEIGLADPADLSTVGVRQTFTNKEQEGRVEVQMTPFNARFAAVTTAFGVQAGHQQLTAPSPDDPGSPLNGLLDPNKNTSVAGYIFNEFKFSDTHQGADRRPHRACQSQRHDAGVHSGAVRPERQSRRHRPADRAQPEFHAEERERRPDPESAVGSGRQRHRAICRARAEAGGIVLARRTRRDRHLRHRQSQSRHRNRQDRSKSDCDGRQDPSGSKRPPTTPNSTASFSAASPATPATMSPVSSPADPAAPLELNQAIYSQRDATFRGGEFQFQLDIAPLNGGFWGIEGQFDVVRATFTDGTNVPRIPPQRVGGGLFWRNANWLTRINLLHAFAQNDIAPIGETPTAGYNLLKAEISYRTKLDPTWFGAREMTVGLVGNNLLNENIRNSVSYTKDQVLMPGIGVRAFANLKF